MNLDDILRTTKFVIQDLDTLKNKLYENSVHSSKVLSVNKIDEKINLLRKTTDTIDLST